MVVDDSAVIRKIVTSTLIREGDIEVVGTAASGKEAVARFRELHPDVITLDIEMPEMNGIEAVGHIRKIDQHIPIIMFSTLTEAGGQATLDALAMGATDYVTKPSNSSSIDASKDVIAHALVGKVRALGSKRRSNHQHSAPGMLSPTHRPTITREAASHPQPTSALSVPGRSTTDRISTQSSDLSDSGQPARNHTARIHSNMKRPSVVVVGISTGGPNALSEVIPALPANLGVPIVIVQHMPATFTRLLAERLDSKSRVNVREAVGGETLRPGDVYIAPGEHHLVINSNARGDLTLSLDNSAPVNSCRPSVDVLFHSAAKLGSSVLALVMTGMGQDGFVGARELKSVGAEVVTQDEATSIVWGMPGYVTNAGLSDQVLALGSIAPFIARRCGSQSGSGINSPTNTKSLVGAVNAPLSFGGETGGQKWR